MNIINFNELLKLGLKYEEKAQKIICEKLNTQILNTCDNFKYDFETIESLEKKINIPLIVAGGAGNESHLIQGLQLGCVSAVATANLFNFIGDGLPKARKKILKMGLNIADWYVID